MIISVEQKTNLGRRHSSYHPKIKMDVRVKCQCSSLAQMHCFEYIVTKVFKMLITPKECLFTLGEWHIHFASWVFAVQTGRNRRVLH
jgi:hypothetical protein